MDKIWTNDECKPTGSQSPSYTEPASGSLDAQYTSNGASRSSEHRFARDKKLPQFDVALNTRKRCFLGLACSFVLSIVLITCGVVAYLYAGRQRDVSRAAIVQEYHSDINTGYLQHLQKFAECRLQWYPTVYIGKLSDGPKEIVILLFSFIVTGTTENLGYIHATSLRWALYNEGRLHHNSNIRLFTSARHSAPNRWYSNVAWAFLLTMLYSCAAQSILADVDNNIGINSLAILLSGICLFWLNLLTSWPLLPVYQKHIVSWNSDPLNTVLALRHIAGEAPKAPAYRIPTDGQVPLRKPNPGTMFIIGYLGVLLSLVFVGGGILVWAFRWYPFDTSFISDTSVIMTGDIAAPGHVNIVQNLQDCATDIANVYSHGLAWRATPAANIFYLVAIQFMYTLALHTVEQLVNLTRDEASWRLAYPYTANGESKTKSGAIIGRESTKAAFTAWPTVLLLILKPVSHWLFGLTTIIAATHEIAFHPVPLFTLGGIMALLTAFATFLACRKPKGPQPAAYGDLRMLGEMIDDWGEGAGQTLYWGDKGFHQDGTRVAGTLAASDGIEPISTDGNSYSGLASIENNEHRKKGKGVWSRLTWRQTQSDNA